MRGLFFTLRTGVDAAETPAMAIFSEPVGMFRLTLTGGKKCFSLRRPSGNAAGDMK
jgi:hypothetical protein